MAASTPKAGPIVRGDDLLPTAEAIALARGFAARACAERAAQAVWLSAATAHTWIDRTPILALAALAAVCPGVTPERLARCLGLDPSGVSARLRSILKTGDWSQDLVAVVAQQIWPEKIGGAR